MAPQPAFSGNKNGAISRDPQRLRSKQRLLLFLKSPPYIVTVYSKYTRELTFEICFCDRRNPWVAIDLGSARKLIPSFYTLRHGKLNHRLNPKVGQLRCCMPLNPKS